MQTSGPGNITAVRNSKAGRLNRHLHAFGSGPSESDIPGGREMAKVPDTKENMSGCICGDCPSFPGSGGFYCAKGKSAQDIRRRGCVCGDCEVFKKYVLADGYYCLAGVAGEGPQ
jgi:hypothetical protein